MVQEPLAALTQESVDHEKAQAGGSAGTLLRKARERQGLHIAALAAQLKVPPRKLELLEQDRIDELPDLAFGRALANAACRTLKIDPATVLALLPRLTTGVLDHASPGLNTPYRENSARALTDVGGLFRAPALWMAALLVAGALTVYFWPSPQTASSGESMVTESVDSMPPTSVDAPAPAAIVAPAAPAPVVPLLQLAASARSFVKVTDGGGKTLLSRALEPGESVSINGEVPLRVSVGNPAATTVQFRGVAVDLPAGAKDAVARLELR